MMGVLQFKSGGRILHNNNKSLEGGTQLWSERGYSNENKDNLIDSVFVEHGRKVLYPNYSIVLYMYAICTIPLHGCANDYYAFY